MPYYLETDDRELLKKLRHTNVCAECAGELEPLYDMKRHLPYLQCKANLEHDGIERPASRYEKGGMAELNIPTRRAIMEQEHGNEKARALDKYMGGGVITRRIATEIVETLWGRAPLIEKTKCILLCQTYQLNPLMRHLYLVGYKHKENGKSVLGQDGNQVYDWSIQIGIGATRLLAQRKHNFSYLDMTPRKATAAELDTILGDTADTDSIYGFVHIKDVDTGAEAYGLRGIKKTANIKGADKGNTHLNQACVRAERQALDRQYPGEMPPHIEAVDERYMEADYQVLDKVTGEITETEPIPDPISQEPQPKEHWCDEHDCAYELKTGRFGDFYAHKKPGGGWCNEIKKKEKDTKQESEPQPAESTETTDEPKNIQQFYNWLNSHGKEFNRTWFLDKMGIDEKTLLSEEGVKAAYEHTKTEMNWQKQRQ